MGKKLIIILVALLLVGCATIRDVEHEKYEKDVFQTADIKTSSVTECDIRTILDSLFTIHTFVFDVYDTNHPPDTLGNYPILIHGESATETHNVTTSTETCVQSTQHTDSVYSHTETEKRDYTQKKTKRIDFVNLLCFVVAIASTIAAYTTYKRK